MRTYIAIRKNEIHARSPLPVQTGVLGRDKAGGGALCVAALGQGGANDIKWINEKEGEKTWEQKKATTKPTV